MPYGLPIFREDEHVEFDASALGESLPLPQLPELTSPDRNGRLSGVVAIANWRDLCDSGRRNADGTPELMRDASYDIWVGDCAPFAPGGHGFLAQRVAEHLVCHPGATLPEPEGRPAKSWRRGLGQSGSRADRILFTGDIHDKGARLCPMISEAADRTDAGTIVVLGDLLNEWDITAAHEAAAFARFVDWVRDERQRRDVIVLLGNHDLAYYAAHGSKAHRGCANTCPGYNDGAHADVHDALLELRPQVMVGFEDAAGHQVLASHAGITQGWYEWMVGTMAKAGEWAAPADAGSHGAAGDGAGPSDAAGDGAESQDDPTAEHVAALVNAFALGDGQGSAGGDESASSEGTDGARGAGVGRGTGLYALGTMVGRERGGWRDVIPSPAWAGKEELARDPLRGYRQIVGHTPVPTIEHRGCGAGTGPRTQSGKPSRRSQAEVWYCDTHSLYRYGQPIGDDSFLLYDRAVGDAWAVKARR